MNCNSNRHEVDLLMMTTPTLVKDYPNNNLAENHEIPPLWPMLWQAIWSLPPLFQLYLSCPSTSNEIS